MFVSANRYIDGTIPVWLIQGLDDFGGWSVAKLIQVVLSYLCMSLSMLGRWCQFRSDRSCYLWNPSSTPIGSLVRLILGYTTLFLLLATYLDEDKSRQIFDWKFFNQAASRDPMGVFYSCSDIVSFWIFWRPILVHFNVTLCVLLFLVSSSWPIWTP